MQGQLERETIEGIIVNNLELNGTINNNSSLSGTLNPITVQQVRDYNKLNNKPKINEIELKNNKSLEDLNVTKLTNIEIENIINSII